MCSSDLFYNCTHNPFEIIHVTVVVPFDVTPRSLEAFANRVVDPFVGYDDVSSFAECRDNTRHCGKGLSIYYASLCAEVGGDVRLGFDVHVLSSVELRWAARANTIGP